MLLDFDKLPLLLVFMSPDGHERVLKKIKRILLCQVLGRVYKRCFREPFFSAFFQALSVCKEFPYFGILLFF